MAEIPERFPRQQLLAGKSKWLKKILSNDACHICLPLHCGMCELLWPNEQTVAQNMAKTQNNECQNPGAC